MELYPALWVLLAAFAALVVYTIFMLFIMYAVFTNIIIASLLPWKLPHAQSRVDLFIEAVRKKFFVSTKGSMPVFRTRFRGSGNFHSGSHSFRLECEFSHHESGNYQVVAYVTDFQPAPMYPGVDSTKRLRIHENGVATSPAVGPVPPGSGPSRSWHLPAGARVSCRIQRTLSGADRRPTPRTQSSFGPDSNPRAAMRGCAAARRPCPPPILQTSGFARAA